MNSESSATQILKQFMRKKIWKKTYEPLASDWQSIREASMIVDEVEDERGYTLNESVRRCIKKLKQTRYLRAEEVEKVKKSTTGKSDLRKYTSTSTRYKLDVIGLWTDFFVELCGLNAEEESLLRSILEESAVERILSGEDLEPLGILSLLSSLFASINRSRIQESKEFLKAIGRVSRLNKNLAELLNLEPLSEDEQVDHTIWKFFKSIKGDNETISELSGALQAGEADFSERLIGFFNIFLKQRANEALENVPGSNFLDPSTKEKFVEVVIEKILDNMPLSVQLLRKIDIAGPNALPHR